VILFYTHLKHGCSLNFLCADFRNISLSCRSVGILFHCSLCHFFQKHKKGEGVSRPRTIHDMKTSFVLHETTRLHTCYIKMSFNRKYSFCCPISETKGERKIMESCHFFYNLLISKPTHHWLLPMTDSTIGILRCIMQCNVSSIYCLFLSSATANFL